METGYARLTVYFEDPFWVGLFERGGGGTWEVCKVTFGSEPRDCEVYAFVLENHRRLQFSPAVKGQAPAVEAANPKRRLRQIRRQLERPPCGTKAQQALAVQRQQGKEAKKRRARENPPSGHCPGGGFFVCRTGTDHFQNSYVSGVLLFSVALRYGTLKRFEHCR